MVKKTVEIEMVVSSRVVAAFSQEFSQWDIRFKPTPAEIIIAECGAGGPHNLISPEGEIVSHSQMGARRKYWTEKGIPQPTRDQYAGMKRYPEWRHSLYSSDPEDWNGWGFYFMSGTSGVWAEFHPLTYGMWEVKIDIPDIKDLPSRITANRPLEYPNGAVTSRYCTVLSDLIEDTEVKEVLEPFCSRRKN